MNIGLVSLPVKKSTGVAVAFQLTPSSEVMIQAFHARWRPKKLGSALSK
jgi:hypothetical protein